ncbi:hypothetical protein HC776_00355 [bacterium]|nr:hypothetical protein [bacterium]
MHAPTLQAFYDRTVPFLQQREAEHNMMLSVMMGRLRRQPDIAPIPVYNGWVESDAGAVVAAAIFADWRLIVSHAAAGYEAALAVLVEDAASAPIEALLLPAEFGAEAVNIWRVQTGQMLIEDFPMRVFRLDSVIPVPNVAGTMRYATLADEALMREWLAAFNREAFGETEIDEARITRSI